MCPIPQEALLAPFEAGLYQRTMDGPLPVLDGLAKAQLPSSERVGRTQQGWQKDGHKRTLQTKSLGSSALLQHSVTLQPLIARISVGPSKSYSLRNNRKCVPPP